MGHWLKPTSEMFGPATVDACGEGKWWLQCGAPKKTIGNHRNLWVFHGIYSWFMIAFSWWTYITPISRWFLLVIYRTSFHGVISTNKHHVFLGTTKHVGRVRSRPLPVVSDLVPASLGTQETHESSCWRTTGRSDMVLIKHRSWVLGSQINGNFRILKWRYCTI